MACRADLVELQKRFNFTNIYGVFCSSRSAGRIIIFIRRTLVDEAGTVITNNIYEGRPLQVELILDTFHLNIVSLHIEQASPVAARRTQFAAACVIGFHLGLKSTLIYLNAMFPGDGRLKLSTMIIGDPMWK
jgi:hypothetical protein